MSPFFLSRHVTSTVEECSCRKLKLPTCQEKLSIAELVAVPSWLFDPQNHRGPTKTGQRSSHSKGVHSLWVRNTIPKHSLKRFQRFLETPIFLNSSGSTELQANNRIYVRQNCHSHRLPPSSCRDCFFMFYEHSSFKGYVGHVMVIGIFKGAWQTPVLFCDHKWYIEIAVCDMKHCILKCLWRKQMYGDESEPQRTPWWLFLSQSLRIDICQLP